MISATEITPQSFNKHLKDINLNDNMHTQEQKAVILQTFIYSFIYKQTKLENNFLKIKKY